jgi:prepilin-type N-terminal cleavage/methylation domain-containing protein
MAVQCDSPGGRHPRFHGFTLIELLTVIALIGLLTGIVIGAGRHAAERGRSARAKAELACVPTAK